MPKKTTPKKTATKAVKKAAKKAPQAARKAAKKTATRAAKKTATKAVKKTATKAVKKTATKAAKKTATKAAKKSPAARRTPRKPAVSVAMPSDLATAAYLNYLHRVQKGLPGDELGDWLAAEQAVQAA